MKKMYSFRLDEDIVEKLDKLGQNRTEIISKLISRAYFIQYCAENGKYPSGFGMDNETKKRMRAANEVIWV